MHKPYSSDLSTYDSEYHYFATVLDPRFKDTLFLKESDLFSAKWTDDCAEALRETFELYYTPDKRMSMPDKSECKAEIIDQDDFESAWRVGISMEYSQDAMAASVVEELLSYLAEQATHMYPLDWWRKNCVRFPRLAEMARDFLSITGSSVAVERVLSTGRDVVSLRRTSQSANIIRVLMTYRAGLFLEKRLQRV